MSHEEIVRAWKSPRYRKGLPAGERTALPANPAGAVELPDGALAEAAGGTTTTVTIVPRTLDPICLITLQCPTLAYCPTLTTPCLAE